MVLPGSCFSVASSGLSSMERGKGLNVMNFVIAESRDTLMLNSPTPDNKNTPPPTNKRTILYIIYKTIVAQLSPYECNVNS